MTVVPKRSTRRFLALGILSLLCTSIHAQDTALQIIGLAHAAHGGRWRSGEITDWIAEGTITLLSVDGRSQTFPIILKHKGKSKIQRLIKQPHGELRQGSDGTKTWCTIADLQTVAHAAAKQFIESQTTYSVQSLFDYQAATPSLDELSRRISGPGVLPGRAVRVIQADKNGRRTRYLIDENSFLITGLEQDIGQFRDPIARTMTTLQEVYALSDFRDVQGIQTPFKMERYAGPGKFEEIQFNSLRYNVGLKDTEFKP